MDVGDKAKEPVMESSSARGAIHRGFQDSVCDGFSIQTANPANPGFISRESLVRVQPLLVAQISREPAEEYHKSPGISCSMLKDYAASPLGYWLRHIQRSAPPKTSSALRAGTLLHTRHELGDEGWASAVEVAPDSAVTAAGQLSKSGEAWLAGLDPGKVGLTSFELQCVNDQWDGILRNPAAAAIIEDRVDAEFNVRWEWDGHSMRCRCDGATAGFWYDLKTTRDQYPLTQFASSVRQWGYDLQSAVYQEAAVAAGWPDERLTFIVISTVYPHHCHVVRLPQATIRRARDRALRYLSEIRQRTEFGHWLPDDYGDITELQMGYWRD